MPSAQRSSDSQSWYFVAHNLPSQFTWQDLKDAIRSEASHSVWTNTQASLDYPSNGRGVIRIKRDDEARNLYRYLTSIVIARRHLVVHLYHSSNGVDAQFVKCNCDNAIQSSVPCPRQQTSANLVSTASIVNWQTVPPASRSPAVRPPAHAPFNDNVAYSVEAIARMPIPNGSPAAPDWFGPYTNTTYPATVSNTYPMSAQPGMTPSASQMHPMPQAEQLQRVPRSTMQEAQQHSTRYVVPASGLPVNTVHGSFPTENAGVFVSNLNFKATMLEIQAYFCHAGKITKCEMQRNSNTGKFKGNATIVYASTDDAVRAIDMFHCSRFQGFLLNVRNDVTTSTHKSRGGVASKKAAEGNCSPVIVNGSTAGRRK